MDKVASWLSAARGRTEMIHTNQAPLVTWPALWLAIATLATDFAAPACWDSLADVRFDMFGRPVVLRVDIPLERFWQTSVYSRLG